MGRLIAIVGFALLLLGCTKKVIEEERVIKVEKRVRVSDSIWKIPILLKDREYKNIETTLIKSRDDFDKFISKIEKKKGWKNRENFLNVLKEANINFREENFLFYSFREDRGYVISAVNPPIDSGEGNVTIKIDKELIDSHLTGKFDYYGLAYKVKKSVKNIIIIDDKDRKVIKNSD